MKQWVKKWIAGILSISLAFACGAPVMAQETSVQEENVLLVSGKAEKLEDGKVLVQNPDAAYDQIVLNITEDTVIINAESNDPQLPDAITDGETVHAYVSKVMTRSMPPISNAAVIFCNVPENSQAPSYTEFQDAWMPQPTGSRVWGTVAEVGEHRLLLENESAVNQKMILSISENTYILDAVTGNPVSFESLQKNQTVYADVGLVMALSEPPIMQAEVVLCNMPADYRAPDFYEISSVFQDDNGSYLIKTDKGGLVSVGENCEIVSYLTKNAVSRSDLIPGSKILVWKDSSAQFDAKKIMLFPYEYRGYLETNGDKAALNGRSLRTKEENGIFYLPLNDICSVLGMSLNRNIEDGSVVILQNGAIFASLDGAGARNADGEEVFLSEAVKLGAEECSISVEDIAKLFQLKLAK